MKRKSVEEATYEQLMFLAAFQAVRCFKLQKCYSSDHTMFKIGGKMGGKHLWKRAELSTLWR